MYNVALKKVTYIVLRHWCRMYHNSYLPNDQFCLRRHVTCLVDEVPWQKTSLRRNRDSFSTATENRLENEIVFLSCPTYRRCEGVKVMRVRLNRVLNFLLEMTPSHVTS